MSKNKAQAMSVRANQVEETLHEVFSILIEPDRIRELDIAAKLVASCISITEEFTLDSMNSAFPTADNVIPFDLAARRLRRAYN